MEQTFLLCSHMEKGDDAGLIEIDIFPHYFFLLDTYNLKKKHRYSQFQVRFVLSSLFILIMKHTQLLYKYFEFCNSAFVEKFFDEINFWP